MYTFEYIFIKEYQEEILKITIVVTLLFKMNFAFIFLDDFSL